MAIRQGLLASEPGSKLRVFDATKEAGKENAEFCIFGVGKPERIITKNRRSKAWDTQLFRPPCSRNNYKNIYKLEEEKIIGKQPIIFDLKYIPYRLKSNATVSEVEKHRKERAFYDMSGDDNTYKYITTERKLVGEETKKFTMYDYLQKSTGVFNQNGMLSKDEVSAMKKRAQTGEKNIWYGFISFDEEHSEMIDHPDKCIALIKQTFGEFFKDAGFEKDNMDLMCALHLDRPTHLHIHYVFWEKEPKVKNKRAAGYKYRAKGKIQMEAIDKMMERLNAYTIPDDLKARRDEAVYALYKREDFAHARYKDMAMKMMKELAKELPPDKPWWYASKDMKPYRGKIDKIVEIMIMTDKDLNAADERFREELERKKTALQDIMTTYYKDRLNEDEKIINDGDNVGWEYSLTHIHTIEKLEWDYKRRLGNIVLKKVKFISDNTYHYNKQRKRKTNDKELKRKLTISSRIIKREMDGFFGALAQIFTPEITSHRNRLREIEEEMQAEHEQEIQEVAREQQKREANARRWDWSK